MENSVLVGGFPQGLNKFKVKLFIENHIGKGWVETLEKEGNNTTIRFQNEEGLRKFNEAEIQSIEFGGSVHPLTILRQTNDGSHHHGTNLLDLISQENLYSKVYHWCDIPTLPAPEKTECILAQNINPQTHIETVITYFQLKKRSGGGPVKCVIRMTDGLLIVFDNINDCKSCLNMIDQTLGEDKLTLFSKIVPEYYRNKFVLEGVGDTTSEDTLKMRLEACSQNETTPTFCRRQALSGVYLIEYGDDYDGSETEQLLQKINSKSLEGKTLKASSLLKTDCLKVTGVIPDISNDALCLLFESSKRSNGGPVTKIDRLKNDSALVYFSSYSVAERVYQKFVHPNSVKLEICGKPVRVQLYYHALANDHTENTTNFQQTDGVGQYPDPGTDKEPKPVLIAPTCDETILRFIFGNRTHSEKLKSVFKDVAEVKFISQPDFRIEFFPSKDLTEEYAQGFMKICEDILNNFLSEYITVSRSFEHGKLHRARSYDLYPEIEQIYRRNPNNDDVFTCWKVNEPVVQITGLKASVDEMAEKIESRVNSVIVTTPSNKDAFRTMLNCGIVDDLCAMYPNVHIKCDEKLYSLVMTGLEHEVNIARLTALTLLNDVDKKILTGLEQSIITFLSKFMAENSDLEVKLHQKFKSNDVKSVIYLDGDELSLKVKSNAEYRKAIDVIKQFIAVEEIKIDAADSKIVNSTEWNSFLHRIKKGLYNIDIKLNGTIVITGFREEVKLLRVEIKKFFEEKSVKMFSIPMGYGFARYIVEHSEDFSERGCAAKDIECGLTPENGGGVYFKGTKNALDAAISKAQEIHSKTLEVPHSLTDPGIQKYYKSSEGFRFIGMTERLNKCVILTMSRECEEWVKFNKHSKNEHPQESSLPRQSNSVDFKEMQITSTSWFSVELSVWKADITKHSCDVIVNPSNTQLLLIDGLSGAIKQLDEKNGDQIQNEMNAIIKKNYGDILPGSAVITSAGNLPACKKIVHAVGPRWNSTGGSDPNLILKACISRSLKRVDEAGLKSIAIPAISCGAFGGSVSVCIPLILEAVFEYLKEERNTSLKKIHFVEKDSKEVLNAFTLLLNTRSNKEQQPSCKVQLIHGDIASCQADVIVNATTPGSLTNMESGPAVSKALAKKAGPSIQQQCSQIPRPHELGKVYETDGGGLLCKKLYHVLVASYDANISQSIIESVVSKCLRMADNSKHESIVFPAIATGGFNHPPHLVAKWMKQEILNFKGKNLKTVVIMLYPKNKSVINAFDAEFKSSPTGSLSSQTPEIPVQTKSKMKSGGFHYKKINEESSSFGPLTVAVYQGDITIESSDVIINSTNSSFNLKQGEISKQILTKGGSGIQREVSNESGNVYRVTSGGNLQCKKVIHLVTPSEPKDLQTKVVEVLQKVENLQMSSVSLPALGTGVLGLNAEIVGAMIRDSIVKFISLSDRIEYLDRINIVIWEDAKLKPFKDSVLRKHPKKGIAGYFWQGVQAASDWITGAKVVHGPLKIEKFTENPIFAMFLYSTTPKNIDAAIKDISKETRRMVSKKVVTNAILGRLTEWEEYEISEIVKKNEIVVTDKSDRYLKQLELVGLVEHVTEAQNAIKDVLRDVQAAENCAAYVTWQKKINGKWVKYAPRSAFVLETAYQDRLYKKTTGPNTVQVPEFMRGAVCYHIVDFSDLIDSTNQTSSNIRRQKNESNDLPSSWNDMDKDAPPALAILSSDSKEYKNIVMKFQSSGSFHSSIVSIERVQNRALYKQYALKKTEVTTKLNNFRKPIERQLFHGTDVHEKIVSQGFDRSFAGKNATVYGRGVYFATTATYSNRYAVPDSNGQKRMFLADVITGEYCAGSQNMIAPPTKPNNKMVNDLYDSVVNDQMNPTIFVIFKDASAYPAYLITYT